MRLGPKIAIAFALGLLIIGGVGLQSYLGIQQVAEKNRWVTHSHEVLENLEQVIAALTDAETGQRGFILTGEDRYLEPYNAATGEIQKKIAAVTDLTSDNPEQQKSLQQLGKLSRDKLDELQETIKFRRDSGLDAALPVIRTDRGRRIMDDIRALVASMERREGSLLDERNRAANEVARNALWTVAIGVLLSLLILAAAAVILTRAMRLAEPRTLGPATGRNWLRIAVRYGFAVAMVALTILMRWPLEKHLGHMPLFVQLYPAVLLVAVIAGGGPGVLATLLGALGITYWFIEPIGSFAIAGANDAVAVGIFTGTGIFVSVLAERLRRARWAEAVSVTQDRELALLNMGNLMTLDLGHRISRWSEGNYRLYGFDAAEARNQLTHELLQTKFDQPLEQIHGQLMEKGYWEGDVTRRTKAGNALSVALLWALRRDEHGKPLAILEVSTDMTRQKAAEDSLRQQSEELAQQNEELSRQSEELAQQGEELSEQNEELQSQSEEIQAINADLARRESMLQTLLDCARLPIGEEEVMAQICQAAMEMMGQSAAGVVVCERHGDELRDLAHAGFDGAQAPATRPAKDSFVNLAIQQDRTASLEDASLRPDLTLLCVPGHERFAAVLASPVRVEGKPIGAVGVFSHTVQPWTAEQFRLIEWLAAQCSNALAAIRLAEEVVRGQKQNKFLANLVEASSQAFGVGYPDGRLGLINLAFERLTGYSGEELRSIDWAGTLTPPEWLEIERQKLDELHRTGVPVRYEKEYLRKDGTRVPIELFVHLVKDAEGKPLYYYSFINDITGRRRAEDALRESEDRFRTMADSMPQLAWIAKGDGFIYWYNRGWYEYTGTTPQQMEGWGWQSVHDPEALPRVLEQWKASIATGNPFEMEFPLRGADGKFRQFLTRGTPLKDTQGRVVQWFGTNTDISERAAAENALRRTADELTRSNKELEQFAYISAHDLQEPLRQVRAFVQMLKDRYADKLDGKAAQYFQFVYDGAARMSDLVGGLLAYSRVGGSTQPHQSTPMQAALDSALADLQASIAESGARVTHDELPTVTANPVQLPQLLQNLIGNAIKFRRDGQPPEIHVGCRGEDGQRVFYVRDNGIGVDPEHHEKIFQIFQRLHGRDNFKYPGTGIGLAICKKIVEQHGGRIWIESSPEQGSTFCFTLAKDNAQ